MTYEKFDFRGKTRNFLNLNFFKGSICSLCSSNTKENYSRIEKIQKKLYLEWYFSKNATWYSLGHYLCFYWNKIISNYIKLLFRKIIIDKTEILFHIVFNINRKISSWLNPSLLILHCQEQPLEMFCKKTCSWKFLKIHRKTPVPASLF